MKIKNIKVWTADLVNTKPYTIAFKTIDEVLNAFVEITLDNGVTGIGAANPSEYVTNESFEQCEKALEENNIQFLIGRDIRELNQLTFEIWKEASKKSGCTGSA
jgi:L-alanine-DL-glutamate epimerase-like enolase superfamily enzyme